MAILSCHVSIKLPPKISDGQETSTASRNFGREREGSGDASYLGDAETEM
jgi:hypothetical protein